MLDIPETPDSKHPGDHMKQMKVVNKWYDWFKFETFYIYGLVYMSARVAINFTLTLQPFYLTQVTQFEPIAGFPTAIQLAIVPLVSNISQLFFSVHLQRKLTEKLKNRFMPLLVALVLTTVGSLPLAFLTEDDKLRWLVYPLAFI